MWTGLDCPARASLPCVTGECTHLACDDGQNVAYVEADLPTARRSRSRFLPEDRDGNGDGKEEEENHEKAPSAGGGLSLLHRPSIEAEFREPDCVFT